MTCWQELWIEWPKDSEFMSQLCCLPAAWPWMIPMVSHVTIEWRYWTKFPFCSMIHFNSTLMPAHRWLIKPSSFLNCESAQSPFSGNLSLLCKSLHLHEIHSVGYWVLLSKESCQVRHLVFSYILWTSVSCYMKLTQFLKCKTLQVWGSDCISKEEMPHGQKVLKPRAGVSYLLYVLPVLFCRWRKRNKWSNFVMFHVSLKNTMFIHYYKKGEAKTSVVNASGLAAVQATKKHLPCPFLPLHFIES